MKVVVDNRPVDDVLVEAGSTVEDALRQVQSRVCGPDRLVIGLRCDGLEVPAHSMADILRKSAGSCGRLEVFTGTRDALVIDAMTQASACLSETEETCVRVVEMLQDGRIPEGAETLAGCMKVWQQIHEAILKSIGMLQLDPRQITIGEAALIELMQKPKDVLIQIRDALVAHDYVLLADLLQFEFKDVTEAWHATVARLRQDAEDLRASRGA